MTLRVRSSGQMPWWFGIPFVLGGLLFAGVGVTLVLDELRFGNEGVAVAGVVTDLDYSPAAGDSGPSYTIRYAFSDSLGVERYGATDVDEQAFDAATIGGPVEVTYLPAEPSKSRVGSPEPQLFVPLLFVAGGLLFAVVGVGLLLFMRAVRRKTLPSWVQYTTGSDPEPDDSAAALAQIFGGTGIASAVATEPPSTQAPPAAPAQPLTEAELRALDARLAPTLPGSAEPPEPPQPPEPPEPPGPRVSPAPGR